MYSYKVVNVNKNSCMKIQGNVKRNRIFIDQICTNSVLPKAAMSKADFDKTFQS